MQTPYKNFLLGFGLSLAMLSTSAQQVISISNFGSAKSKQGSKGQGQHKAILASLTCLTPYVTDTTMDLTFRLSLTNTDEEYGDSLQLTFPTGIVPISSPNNPLYVAPNPMATPEAYNGVSGQSISWGDNDNVYGGIVPSFDAVFTVRVTINSGVSGDKSGTFFVSGDEYGPSPADFSGSFALTQTPTPPNIAVVGFGPFPYYGVPFNHTYSSPLTAVIRNNGGTLSQDVTLQFFAFPGGFNDTKSLPNPMATDAVVVIDSDPFTPASAGLYNTLFNATFLGDDNNLDNKDSAEFELTNNYFAANKGDTATALGLLIGEAGSLAHLIQLQEADTLNTVNVFFDGAELNTTVNVSVLPFDTATGTVGSAIVTGPTYTFTSTGSQYRNFNFDQILPAGNYLISVNQLDTLNYVMASSFDNYAPGFFYAKLGPGDYRSLESYPTQLRRSFFMRTFFGAIGGVGIADNLSNDVSISPNPTSGLLTIAGVDNASIQLTDNLGRVVYNGTISAENNRIAIDQLQSGNYVVSIKTTTGIAHKQIVLVK